MRILPLILIGSLTVLGTTAIAGDDIDPSDGAAIVAHVFEMSDLDEDGVLSADEYSEAGLEEFGLSFEACDADADGVLTSDEYLELYRQHHNHAADAGLDV